MSGKNPPLTSPTYAPERVEGTNVFESNAAAAAADIYHQRYSAVRWIIHFVVDKVPLIAYRVSTVRIVNANTVYRFRTFIIYSFRASSIKQLTRHARARF